MIYKNVILCKNDVFSLKNNVVSYANKTKNGVMVQNKINQFYNVKNIHI